MLCTVVVHVLLSYLPGLWDELAVHVAPDFLGGVCC